MIRTTLNLKASEIELLHNTMVELNMSFSDLIAMIINKIIKSEFIVLDRSNAVKYLERKSKLVWKIKHISISERNYEILTGLRKIAKKSASFIISEGIMNFLEEIIKDLKSVDNERDNYLSDPGYFISCKIVDGKHHFKIVWGLPKSINESDNYPGKNADIQNFFSIIKNMKKIN